MKVVFLDVDGVLNAGRPVSKTDYSFLLKNWTLPHPIRHLNRIARETGAKFVFSSAWRIGNEMDDIRQQFRELGFEGELIDRTPDLFCDCHEGLECERSHRGAEIAAWLARHQDVEAFVILDDNADMGALMSRLVQTKWYQGLLRPQVDRAIRMLGRTRAPK